MKRDTTGIRSIAYEGYQGPRLSPEVQQQRLQRVIREELSPIQREVLVAYYIEGLTLEQIARRRGVCRSSVCRALHRAEACLRLHLKY